MVFNGVFSVLPTPFFENGAVDFESLKKTTRFFAGAGVDGLVALGVTSEVGKLTDREQADVLACVLNEAPAKMPVIAGATSDGLATSIDLSRRARTLGAVGVMVGPPRMHRANSDAVVRHFAALGDAIGMDIVLQDYPAVSGFAMETALIVRLAAQVPAIKAIKLEDPPTAPKIAALRAAEANGVRTPIFGGLGGACLFEELLAGSTGAMTGFAFPEVLVAVVQAYHAGRVQEAADSFYRYVPAIRLEAQEGVGLGIRKEFLRRRGLIERAELRAPAGRLDTSALAAIDHVLDWTGLSDAGSDVHPWS